MTQAKKSAVPSNASQTLTRGLMLLELVASDVHSLEALAKKSGLTRSTAHRLLATLVQQGYLRNQAGQGYFLGPRIIELGFKGYEKLDLPQIARPHMIRLSEATKETVHLAILDGTQVMYIEKVQGSRSVRTASHIGARLPVQCTALGKALVSTLPESRWADYFSTEIQRTPRSVASVEAFVEEVRKTADRGYALDLEENEPGIRCIAAPVRDGSGQTVAALSLSSLHIYLSDEQIDQIAPLVKDTATKIGRELGWSRS
jgi:DNA-binding IclR family transcriptional regulator